MLVVNRELGKSAYEFAKVSRRARCKYRTDVAKALWRTSSDDWAGSALQRCHRKSLQFGSEVCVCVCFPRPCSLQAVGHAEMALARDLEVSHYVWLAEQRGNQGMRVPYAASMQIRNVTVNGTRGRQQSLRADVSVTTSVKGCLRDQHLRP